MRFRLDKIIVNNFKREELEVDLQPITALVGGNKRQKQCASGSTARRIHSAIFVPRTEGKRHF